MSLFSQVSLTRFKRLQTAEGNARLEAPVIICMGIFIGLLAFFPLMCFVTVWVGQRRRPQMEESMIAFPESTEVRSDVSQATPSFRLRSPLSFRWHLNTYYRSVLNHNRWLRLQAIRSVEETIAAKTIRGEIRPEEACDDNIV
ncbi:MAG: uncharacterized protein KVP18_002219 [Porospora cf. gigantea A]|uniref:uncharacterized protein n=1 Tax=Porospora cf. gigantea A TaxID=2853593 RepID=UPI00355A7699|nr:MAG: hypothetical protein KVP18_002219 [Porospora cf. gigantea A]